MQVALVWRWACLCLGDACAFRGAALSMDARGPLERGAADEGGGLHRAPLRYGGYCVGSGIVFGRGAALQSVSENMQTVRDAMPTCDRNACSPLRRTCWMRFVRSPRLRARISVPRVRAARVYMTLCWQRLWHQALLPNSSRRSM